MSQKSEGSSRSMSQKSEGSGRADVLKEWG